MEEYPEELRTPPVPLIAVVGYTELHSSISAHLHSQKPPINTLALPDFSKISVIGKTPKPGGSDSPPGGILRRDWLLKHRTKIPAVVAALIPSDQVSGDPAQWLGLCTLLDQLKYGPSFSLSPVFDLVFGAVILRIFWCWLLLDKLIFYSFCY